jgi:hypothetical protein
MREITMTQKIIGGLLLSIATFTSCVDKQKTIELQSDDNSLQRHSFESPYDTLDKIKLPVKWDPESWNNLYLGHRDKYGLNHEWDIFQHPYARLSETDNYKAIIFISTGETGSPAIATIGKDQKPIDTLFLLGDWGGNDPSYGVSEVATISTDLNIHLLDSVMSWELDEKGTRREETKYVEIQSDKYKILENGKFKKID